MDKCLFISKSAVLDNVKYYIKETNKNIIAVIKNNAYGHGVKEMVSILEEGNIKMYAVSNIKEAKLVRGYTNKDILIMDRVEDYSDIDNNMVITIISKKHLKEVISLKTNFRIHLKVNLKMKRKGVEKKEFKECLSLIRNSNLTLEGVYSHYSSYKIKKVKKEFLLFQDIIQSLENKDIMIHASSSISSLVLKEDITNTIRLGIGMYGLKKLVKEMLPLQITTELKCWSKNVYPIRRFNTFSYDNRYYGKKGYIVMANLGYGDGLFFKEKIRGYIEENYIKEIGIRNMDNMYFYSKDYIMDNTCIEIYGHNNQLDYLSKKYKIAVCRLLALLNEHIDKKIIQ